MHRRSLLWGVLSAAGAAFAASPSDAATEAAPAAKPGEKLKVVYHLSDADKVSFVLGNIQNHLDGVGGPEHVTIALSSMARLSGRFMRRPPIRTSAGGSAAFPRLALNSPPAVTP
jgi:hypothetical protein